MRRRGWAAGIQAGVVPVAAKPEARSVRVVWPAEGAVARRVNGARSGPIVDDEAGGRVGATDLVSVLTDMKLPTYLGKPHRISNNLSWPSLPSSRD